MHLLIKSCLARGTWELFEYHCEKVVPSMCMSCLICYLFRQRNERLKEKFPPIDKVLNQQTKVLMTHEGVCRVLEVVEGQNISTAFKRGTPIISRCVYWQ